MGPDFQAANQEVERQIYEAIDRVAEHSEDDANLLAWATGVNWKPKQENRNAMEG